MSNDRRTPILADLLAPGAGDQQAIQIGTDFLATKEAQLQAQLGELEAELAGLEEVPDQAQALAGRATDSLRTLVELVLSPVQPAPMPTPRPEAVQVPLVTPQRTRPRIALLLVTAAWLLTLGAALYLFWQYARPAIAGGGSAVATVALVTPDDTPVPTSLVATDPPPVSSTTSPLPTPIPPRPSIPGSASRGAASPRAQTLQIVSGTLPLEIPLAAMTETVRLVEGVPVLEAILPTDGAGLYRNSAPFGQAGATIVVLDESVPYNLQQAQPGQGLTGCNDDGTCFDYRVTAAQSWDLARLQQTLADQSADMGLLLYIILDESRAWVVQARLREEGGR